MPLAPPAKLRIYFGSTFCGPVFARLMKTLIAAGLFGFISLAAFAFFRHDGGAGLAPLKTVRVERGDLKFAIGATGTVEPEEVVDVGAQVAGKIISLGADRAIPQRRSTTGRPSRKAPSSP